MQKCSGQALGIALFLLFSFSAQRAFALEFLVLDQNGNALEDVVVEITSKSAAAPNTSAGKFIIDQVDKSFLPKVTIVTKDSRISFPNSDNIRHHVYSFSSPKVFELKLYADKPEKPVVFDKSGIVVLGCNIHDSMVGYVYITESPFYGKTNAQGRVVIDISSDMIAAISIWHPQNADGVDSRVSLSHDAMPSFANGRAKIRLDTVQPTLRNSFEDVFR